MAIDLNHLEALSENKPGYPDLSRDHPDTWHQLTVYNAFKDFYGRVPTEKEFGMFTPGNGGDDDARRAIAQQSDLEDKINQQKAQPDVDAAALDAKAKDHYGDVGNVFKQTLGRDATQDELDHFGKMIAGGQADAYTLGQALQTLPEYTSKQDQTSREALRTELSSADSKYMNEQVFPQLQSQFAQQGRDVSAGSAGLQAALANAAKATNNQRETYLATIGHEDYSNQRQQVINNYLNNQARAYQTQDQNTMRGYQVADQNTARATNIQDYFTQQQAYNDYLANWGRKATGSGGIFMGAAQGGLSGAAIGATASQYGNTKTDGNTKTGTSISPGWGTLLGSLLGAGLGAYGASQQKGIY